MTRVRWLFVLGCVVGGAAAVVVPAVGAAPAGKPLDRAFSSAAPDFKAAVRRTERRRERLRSADAKRERRRSRSRFRGVGRSRALDVGRRAFRNEFNGRLYGGRRPSPGMRVVKMLGRGRGVVRDPSGRKLLLASSLPLETKNATGDERPVDLSLTESKRAFRSVNPLVPVRVARRSRAGVAFGAGATAFTVIPAGVDAVGREVSDRVFFAGAPSGSGALTDTDVLVAPRAAGAEIGWQLRSSASPERLVLDVDIPAGAVLRRARTSKPIAGDPPRAIEIAKGHRGLGYIYPPNAYDADGSPVRSEAKIEGDRIVVRVDHRDADVRYPIFVDPEVGLPNAGWYWPGWTSFQNPGTGYYPGYNFYGFALANCAYYCGGAYLSMPTNTTYSPSGTGVGWYYQAPANTYIYRAAFGNMAHSPLVNGYQFSVWLQGLLAPSGHWEQNINYVNQAGGWGPNPFGPAGHAASGVTHDFCFNPRCTRGQGSEQNLALLALGAYNPYTGASFSTGPYRATLTMESAGVLLGDRRPPAITSAKPPDRGWSNDAGATHALGATSAADLGLGVYGMTLSGAAWGNGTLRPSCTNYPYYAAPCPANWSTNGFSYKLNEGVNTLSLQAHDIVDNNSGVQTWTEKIDRTKPKLELNGWLPNTDGMIFSGIDYDLSVAASDGLSGVKSIEVLVDGKRLAQDGFKEQDCATGSCELILNTALSPGSYSPGTHTVKIVAKDFAGNDEQVELPVEISDASASPPRERDEIPDEPGDDGPEPASEPGIDTTCDPNATDGSDTDCARDDLADPIEQAVSNEPGLVENLLSPLLNTLDTLLSPSGARAAGIAPPLNKNGSGWGLSDNKPQTFVPDNAATPNRIDNPLTPQIDEGYLDLFTALDVTRLRLTVPWDLVPRARGRFDGDPYPKSFENRNASEPSKDRITVGLGPFHDDPATPQQNPNEVRDALTKLKAVDEWIARALPCAPAKRLGEVMISFEKSDALSASDSDKRHENLLPTPDEYVYGVSQFRKRYLGRCQEDKDLDESSRITVFTAWNEANFDKQPTRGDRLGRAGVYWSRLNRICKTTLVRAYRCTVAAGDFIDRKYSTSPEAGLNGDVRRFAKGMNRTATAWALHTYRSSHQPLSVGQGRIKRFLNLTTSKSGYTPRLWLTEQGGRYDVPATEPDPTPEGDFCRIMQFRKISNRITRLYYYPLVGPPPQLDGTRKNDSALIALNADLSITPRDPQYETYKFYTTKSSGSQRCPDP